MLSQRPLACRPPKRPGFTNNGLHLQLANRQRRRNSSPVGPIISTAQLAPTICWVTSVHTNCIRLSRVQPALYCSRLTECPAAAATRGFDQLFPTPATWNHSRCATRGHFRSVSSFVPRRPRGLRRTGDVGPQAGTLAHPVYHSRTGPCTSPDKVPKQKARTDPHRINLTDSFLSRL